MTPTLAAWLHDINPFLWEISKGFGLRWYGLSYATGFVVGWALLRWCARKRIILLSPEQVTDAILAFVVGVVVGGRLGYVLFYKPELLWAFSNHAPWWGVLRVNEGGMSSHGGMIGVILACWKVSRGRKGPDGVRHGRISQLHLIDLTALACPIGLGLGRVANFINGELLGKIVAQPGELSPWWAVKFPQELLSEMRADEMSPAREMSLVRLVPDARSIDDPLWTTGVQRLVHDLQHGSAEAAAKLGPVLYARHPSQLYQFFTDGVVLMAVLWWIWRKPRKPGVVGAWFLIVYGIMRVITEFWRLPDAHLQTQRTGLTWIEWITHAQRVLGLSRGQWLSVAMIIVGLVGLAIVSRRPEASLGGWAVRPATAKNPPVRE